MKLFAAATLFAGALAMPTAEIEARANNSTNYNPCPSALFSVPICANLDFFTALCLDVEFPSKAPRDALDFRLICATAGKQARCSTIPLLGLGIFCIPPVGV
ncbi:hypothetical protein NHJ13734_004546 [Beauveria thailandica]